MSLRTKTDKGSKKPGMNAKVIGPPWAPRKMEVPAMKGKDLFDETVAKIEEGTGRKLTDTKKDYLSTTMALVKKK